MANVTVKIPNYGQGVGTLAWLEKQLASAKITTGHTEKKKPGLWIEVAGKKSFLCIIFNARPDSPEESFRVGEFWAMVPKPVASPCDNESGLFEFLTPAAEAKCAEFIRASAEAFAEGLKND